MSKNSEFVAKFDSFDWRFLLAEQPQFADKCNKWAEFDEDEKEALPKPMLPASSTPGSTFTASIIMTMKMAMTAPAAAVEAAARTEKTIDQSSRSSPG